MPTPIRFPTEAANSDSMEDETPGPAAKNLPEAPARGKKPQPENRDDEAKPGMDINAPGFVRDKDAGKP
jgi:hypothetical protein